ncbi:MAG: orotidine-5'-phosphate decarboxylase [Planctomycetia bacterium]
MVPDPFFDRLEARRRERRTTLCVGIDPRLDQLPAAFRQAGDARQALTRFGLEVLEITAPYAACYKPQIAFFEAHGLPGLMAYATIVAEARRKGLLVIGDIKRGDIGTTAEAYAAGHLAPGSDFEVDAVTLNPWMGRDALAPFVKQAAAHGKGLYVLVRTSNPGAADLQDLALAGAQEARVFERAADLVASLGAPHVSAATGLSAVGAVVGATGPQASAALRQRLPSTPFLVPGYGAQGATARDVAVCYRQDGSGAVINASRSIVHPPGSDTDWRGAVEKAAKAAREDLDAGR